METEQTSLVKLSKEQDTSINHSLINAVKANDFQKVKSILNESELDINFKDSDGNTALIYAIQNENEKIFPLLLRLVDYKDHYYKKKLIDISLEKCWIYKSVSEVFNVVKKGAKKSIDEWIDRVFLQFITNENCEELLQLTKQEENKERLLKNSLVKHKYLYVDKTTKQLYFHEDEIKQKNFLQERLFQLPDELFEILKKHPQSLPSSTEDENSVERDTTFDNFFCINREIPVILSEFKNLGIQEKIKLIIMANEYFRNADNDKDKDNLKIILNIFLECESILSAYKKCVFSYLNDISLVAAVISREKIKEAQQAKPSTEANEEPKQAKPSAEANEEPKQAKPSAEANEEPKQAKPSAEANEEPKQAKPSAEANEEPKQAKPSAEANEEPQKAKPSTETESTPKNEPNNKRTELYNRQIQTLIGSRNDNGMWAIKKAKYREDFSIYLKFLMNERDIDMNSVDENGNCLLLYMLKYNFSLVNFGLFSSDHGIYFFKSNNFGEFPMLYLIEKCPFNMVINILNQKLKINLILSKFETSERKNFIEKLTIAVEKLQSTGKKILNITNKNSYQCLEQLRKRIDKETYRLILNELFYRKTFPFTSLDKENDSVKRTLKKIAQDIIQSCESFLVDLRKIK